MQAGERSVVTLDSEGNVASIPTLVSYETGPLLHSMSNFWGLIEPLLEAWEPESLCELGVEGGAASTALLRFCRDRNCRYIGVDPACSADVASWIGQHDGILHETTSLEYLQSAQAHDVYLIDGDHNYYTLKQELDLTLRQSAGRQVAPLWLLHDVCWPCDRRDMYYNPKAIPEEFLHPHSWEMGVVPDQDTLVPGGFRSMGRYAIAKKRGGLQNGTMSAIDELLAANGSMSFLVVPAVFGLGVLYDANRLGLRQRTVIDRFRESLKMSADILHRMETNRTELYVGLIEAQEGAAALHKEASRLRKADAALRGRIDYLAQEVRQRTETVEALQGRIAASESKLAAARDSAIRLHGEIAELERTRGEFAEKNTLSEQAVHCLRRDNERLLSLFLHAHHQLDLAKASLPYRVAMWGLRQGIGALRYTLHAARALREIVEAWVTAGEATDNLDALIDQLASFTTISFDVFDTLVRRDVDPPELVKQHTAKWVEIEYQRRGIPLSEHLFAEQRGRIEQKLRCEALANGSDFECSIRDVLSQTIESCTGQRPCEAEVERIVQYEVERDISHISVMPGAESVLRGLAERGKSVVVETDTYYESEDVRRILNGLGIGIYVARMYSSADALIAKHSGRLFGHVVEKEEGSPEATVHIGDNWHSDVVAARKKGINGIWFRNRDESARRKAVRKACERVAIPEHLLSVLEENFETGEKPPAGGKRAALRTLYRIGHDCIGPSFCAFALHVLDSAVRDRLDRLFFLARDSAVFIELAGLLANGVRRYREVPMPSMVYLKVSRLSTTLPAVHELGERELLLSEWDMKDKGFEGLLRKLGLCSGRYGEFTPSAATTNADPERRKAQLKRILEDCAFHDRVQEDATAARALLAKYLEQEGFWGSKQRCGFVDMGWNGTIQANITAAFSEREDFPFLSGYYYGRNYTPINDYNQSRKSVYSGGFAYDEFWQDMSRQAVGQCPPLFECAGCARQGSVEGYRSTAHGGVEPVQAGGWVEDEHQTALQRGIMDYAQQFAQAYDRYEPSVHLLRDAAGLRLRRLVYAPRRAEAQALARIGVGADWGGKHAHHLVVRPLCLFDLLRPKQAWRVIDESWWKSGILTLSPLPLAATVYRYWKWYVR